ncbi:hypothetical protein ACTXT7_007113 [Hymenolepis weldensis]
MSKGSNIHIVRVRRMGIYTATIFISDTEYVPEIALFSELPVKVVAPRPNQH